MRKPRSNRVKSILKSILFMVLTTYSLMSFSATIQVTAQIGEVGCDLAEAITAANTNSPVGGCVANAGSFILGGSDVIVLNFSVPIREFIVSTINIFNSGLPSISSEITIVGRGGPEKVVIKRSEAPSTPEFRFLTVTENGNLTLENISMQNGRLSTSDTGTPRSGGAIWIQGGVLEINNSEFINNQSSLGGALSLSNNDDSTVVIRNTLFSNNRATEDFNGGGAILHGRGSLTIIDSEFVENQAQEFGGSLSLNTDTTTVIRSTLFANNEAGRDGGAIGMNSNATASIYDSTISGNKAGNINGVVRFGYGGGIAVSGGAGNDLNLNITNTTISENSAPRGGGIGLDSLNSLSESTLTIINSILSGNSSTESFISSQEAFFGSQMINLNLQNNLIGHSAYTTAEALEGDEINLDTNILATNDGNRPRALINILQPLADNGGPTRTHALSPNSPAIDAATDGMVVQVFVFTLYLPGCRAQELMAAIPLPEFRSDQRGIARPIGGACDIGAYEEQDPNIAQCFVVKAVNAKVLTFCL